MNNKKLQISISLFQSIAFRIQSLQARIQNFEEKKKLIASKYYSQLNDLIIQEINLKNLLSKKCTLTNFSQFQSIIFDSKILGPAQNDVLSLLLLFQTQPQMLVKSISSKNTQVDQKFMNYLLNDFYSDFLNSQCSCKANLNKYVFIYLLLDKCFLSIKSFDDVLNNSSLIDTILNGLIKNPSFFKFSKGLYKQIKKNDCLNKFIAQKLEQERQNDCKNQIQTQIKQRDSNSQKYENILFNSQDNQRGSFLSQISLSHDELNEIKQSQNISNEILYEMLKIFKKCIRDYLPSSIKFFYFTLKKLSEKNNIDYLQVITLFFLQRFIVKLMSEKQQMYKYNPMKNYRMNFIAKIVQQFSQFCQEIQKSGKVPMNELIKELCYYPKSKYETIKKRIKKLKINEKQNETKCLFSKDSFNSNQTKSSTFTQDNKIQYEYQISMLQSKNQSYIEQDEQLSRNTAAFEIKSQIYLDLESQKTVYRDRKFYSVGGKHDNQNQIDKFQQDTEEHFDNCTFHWEGISITYENLGFFIDLYEDIGEPQDLLKLEVLRAISDKNINNQKKDGKYQTNDVYILFTNQLKNSSLQDITFQENPYEKLFNLNQMSYNKLEDFEDKSIFSFLKYYKKNIYTENYDEQITIEDLINLFKNKELSQIYFTSQQENLFEEQIDELQQKLFVVKIQQLCEKLIIYEKQIEELYLNLIKKKQEIILIKEQKKFIDVIQRVIIKQQLHYLYSKILNQTKMNLCFDYENQKKDNKTLLIDGIAIKNTQACNKQFTYQCNNNLLGSIPKKNHVHFQYFSQILEYFQDENYIEELVLNKQYAELITFVIDFQKKNFIEELSKMVPDKLKKQIDIIYETDNYVQSKFFNFLDKIIYNRLFPINQIKRDQGFQVSCEVFEFIDIKHFYKYKNADLIRKNLGPIIKKIKQLEFQGSWDKKIQCITICFQKLAKLLENINKSKPGSEEMQPLITYCIIKAKPFNMLSNLTFMSVLNRYRLEKGQTAFILTNLEIGIQIIEKLTPQVIKMPNYNQFLLEKEVQTGIHQMRKRPQNNLITIKKNINGKLFYCNQFNQSIFNIHSFIFTIFFITRFFFFIIIFIIFRFIMNQKKHQSIITIFINSINITTFFQNLIKQISI